MELIDYKGLVNYKDTLAKQSKRREHRMVAAFCILTLGVYGVAGSVDQSAKVTPRVAHVAPVPPPEQIKIAARLQATGHPDADKVAAACMTTTRPKLMAAIAIRERTPVAVRKGGYKGKHAGAWQLNQEIWGAQPTEPVGQAQAAERALEQMIAAQKGDLKKGLNMYGGDRSKKIYAQNVLRELEALK